MKPQSQITRQLGSRLRAEMPAGLRSKQPATDFSYQAPSADFRVAHKCAQRATPSFRDLSDKFLAGEMKRDYLAEALCFLIIVSVSAWPIVSMVRAFSLLK